MNTQLWACTTCQTVGAVVWLTGDKQDEVQFRIFRSHEAASPDCRGSRYELLTLPGSHHEEHEQTVAPYVDFKRV